MGPPGQLPGQAKKGGQELPDHSLGRSRGGWGSKLHLVTDGLGLPLAVHVTAGKCHESKKVCGNPEHRPYSTAVRTPTYTA